MLAGIFDEIEFGRTQLFGVKMEIRGETKGRFGQVPEACGQPSAVNFKVRRLSAVSLLHIVDTK